MRNVRFYLTVAYTMPSDYLPRDVHRFAVLGVSVYARISMHVEARR